MKAILPYCILIAGLPSLSQAQTVEPAKRKEILEMVQMTGVTAIVQQMTDQCIAQAKAKNPTVPESFWQAERGSFKIDRFIEAEIALFDKYFTLEDLKAVVAFYKTPAGQDYIRALPAMSQESMRIAQTWASQSGAATVAHLRAAGYVPGQ